MLNIKAAGVLEVRMIAGWMNRITLSFARKPIKAPAELKGKKIAISRFGASSDFVTRMLMRYWKLDPEKDVTIIQSGGNDALRIAALVAGHVDGALCRPTAQRTRLQADVSRGPKSIENASADL